MDPNTQQGNRLRAKRTAALSLTVTKLEEGGIERGREGNSNILDSNFYSDLVKSLLGKVIQMTEELFRIGGLHLL